MMFLWIALLIVLIVLAARWLGMSNPVHNDPDAMEALRQRYARGEIDTTEFEDHLRNLRTGR
jgi:putative membrane protein